jgi:outer membrane protein, multidrug efflux system
MLPPTRCAKVLRSLLISGVVSLSGCAIWGPDYETPKVETPEAWKSEDQYAKLGGTALPEMAWWQKMHDPVLDDLVARALVQNNNVQAAVGAVFKARAILQQIQMRWVPKVDAGVGFISTPNEINPTTVTSIPFSGFTAGFIPNYELNVLQQLRTQEQAEANVQVSVAAKNAVRLTLIGQIVGSYYGLRLEQYRLELQKDLVAALSEIVEKYTMAHQEGLISQYVLREYTLNLANAKAEIPVIEYNIVRFSNTLHALLNENPGPIGESRTGFMDVPSTGIIAANLPSTVLKNRPDVAAAEDTLRQSNANIGVQTTFFFPTFNLTGPVGQSSGSLSNLFTNPTSYWQYQGGFQVPIVNLGQFGAIKGAKAQYYTDYYNYQQTIRNAFAAVDSDLSSHQKYTESLDQMKLFWDTTRQRFDNESQRHREGLVSYPDVLNLRVTRDQAGIQTAQTKYNQLMSIVRLYQDLGGGYQVNNNEDAHDLGDGHRFGDLF